MLKRTIVVGLAAATMLGVAAGQQSANQQGPDLKERNPAPSVATVAAVPGNAQLPTGTDLHVRLETELSTSSAKVNDPFNARVVEPVMVDGNVMVPAGTLVQGRVADVTSTQRRFRGKVSLRLLPQRIVMADGRMFDFTATMIDSDQRSVFTVGEEGDISSRATHDARMALIGTGVGAVVGGVIGAQAGALIGAGIGASLPAARWATRNNSVELAAGSQYWFETTTPLRAGGSSGPRVIDIPPANAGPQTE